MESNNLIWRPVSSVYKHVSSRIRVVRSFSSCAFSNVFVEGGKKKEKEENENGKMKCVFRNLKAPSVSYPTCVRNVRNTVAFKYVCTKIFTLYIYTWVCRKRACNYKLRIFFVYEEMLPSNSGLVSGQLLPFPSLDPFVIIFQNIVELLLTIRGIVI